MLETFGGFRIGAIKTSDSAQALKEAVALAKESDMVVIIAGLNYDFESEGCKCPGSHPF